MSNPFDKLDLSLEDLNGPKVDRRTTMKLLAAGGMAGFAGCLGGNGEDGNGGNGGNGNGGYGNGNGGETPSEDQHGGRLQAGWSTSETGSLNPAFQTTRSIYRISNNIFSAPLKFNSDAEIVGDLATDWEISDDGLTYTMELKDDVTFHNGDHFTADDLVFTLAHAEEQDYFAWDAHLEGNLRSMDDDGAVAVDDYTIEFNWEEPIGPGLAYLTRGVGRAACVLNQNALEEMGEEEYGLMPVSTGAFKVVDHELHNTITLDRFEDYHEMDDDGNQLPYLDGVDITLVPEADSAANGLATGELHFIQEPAEESIDVIDSVDNAQVIQDQGANFQAFGFNQEREPFDDPQFRLAIAKAIDEEQFIEDAFFGTADYSGGPIGPSIAWAYRDDKPDTQTYDPEGAMEILEEIGQEDATIEIMIWTGGDRWVREMAIQLEEVGIEVEEAIVPVSTYSERQTNGDFDAIFPGAFGRFDPDQFLYTLYHSEGAWSHWNAWSTDEMDDLLERQRREVDLETRTELMHEIEDMLIEDVVDIYLGHHNDLYALSNDVGGYVSMAEQRNFHTVYLNE